MGQHQKDVKDLKTDRGHYEEVDGHQLLGVILQKCTPSLRDQRTCKRELRILAEKSSLHQLPMCSTVSEQFLAFLSEKTAGDGDWVIALSKNEPAGDETGPPLAVFRTMLAAISGNLSLNPRRLYRCR